MIGLLLVERAQVEVVALPLPAPFSASANRTFCAHVDMSLR